MSQQMTQKRRTPEERLLLQVYDMAAGRGDLYGDLDPWEVASELQLSPKKAKTLLRNLYQGNFLKKVSDQALRLTPHGERYVNQLLS